MAALLHLESHSDKRGGLSVLEDHQLPFTIKRLYYIYDLNNEVRGGHRHKKTSQVIFCLSGHCSLKVNNKGIVNYYTLSDPKSCLLLEPGDWHELFNFKKGSIILVGASEYYDPNDYIYTSYPEKFKV